MRKVNLGKITQHVGCEAIIGTCTLAGSGASAPSLPKISPSTCRYPLNLKYKTKKGHKRRQSSQNFPGLCSIPQFTEGLLCTMSFRTDRVPLAPGWGALTVCNRLLQSRNLKVLIKKQLKKNVNSSAYFQ